jgi:hypothetical protein
LISNFGRGIRIQRLDAISLVDSASDKNRAPGAMAAGGERAQTLVTGHGARQGFFLCYLEVERDSFCKLMVKETVAGGQATTAWFGQHLATVRAASDEALAPRFVPVMAVQVGAPPPSVNSVRGCFGKMNRWWQLARRRQLGFGSNSHGIGHYL